MGSVPFSLFGEKGTGHVKENTKFMQKKLIDYVKCDIILSIAYAKFIKNKAGGIET